MIGTTCNVPVNNIDVANFLPNAVNSNGLVIGKLKPKPEYCGDVLFKVVRQDFLHSMLSYVRQNKYFYKDSHIKSDLENH